MLIVIAINFVLSGAVIPLAFFPAPLDTLLRLTPFASILQAPIDIYVGDPLGGSVALVLALQAHLGARAATPPAGYVLAAGTRKLVLQGG